MPLWKIYHPAGTYNAEDKKLLAEKITGLYASIPLPKFYVVVIFEEMAPRFLLCRRRAEQQFYPVQGRPYCEDLAWPGNQGMVDQENRRDHRLACKGPGLRLGGFH